MRTAGIVLAGGRSSRMGRPKADLEWHGSTLARRAAGIVGREAGPVVVVAAPGQALPPLGAAVTVARDAVEGGGPLAGIRAGLAALGGGVDAVYVAALDLPLLSPAAVARALAALAGDAEAAVPRAGGRIHPLAAAYRAAPLGAALGRAGSGRAGDLLDGLRVAWLDEDPEVLRNVNDPAAYAAARALPAPLVRVAVGGAPAAGVRAATLGAALAGRGARAGVVTVGGRAVDPDPQLPLAEGDLVEIRPG